jgi:Serine carboxypeptidase
VNDHEKEETVYLIDWSRYFRTPEVRKALNIPDYIPWFQFSSDEIFENFQFAIEGSGFINDVLRMHGYKMMLVFGDTDGACSVLGTRKWIKSLGWK